ncbi:MAG: hypothetical protein KDB03_27775 [Planctomycetales bacterium]|nr:hypothetical protein [Planctomycetales bacterium]
MSTPRFDAAHFRNDGTECKLHDECPLSAPHSRLREAHRHFHDAELNYADPDAFTSYLNGCIQALRNVTFVLQKSKSFILGFDEWYSPWQDRLRDDPILRWVVHARNRIVKKGDLETFSVANVSIVNNYSSPPAMQMPFPPCESLESLGQFLVEELPICEQFTQTAMLRVERRWVANDIAQLELLHALAHAYTTLAYLIRDAHGPLQAPVKRTTLPEHLPGQPLPCMTELDESRVSYTRYKDKQILTIQRQVVDRSKLPVDKARERYGKLPAATDGAFKGPENLEATCQYLFSLARMIMEKDGHHQPFVFYLTERGLQLGGFQPEDRTDKLLIWRSVASEVERLRAYAVIHIAEVWVAQFDPAHPDRSATDSPNRDEALALAAISSRGEYICWNARIYHSSEGVILGDNQDASHGTPYYFEPVVTVWRSMFGRASVAPTKNDGKNGVT